MNPRLLAATIGLLWLGAASAALQEVSQTFQFVSIRILPGVCPQGSLCIGESGRNPSSAPSSISVLPGGRFEARNQTFENLVRLAFGFEGVDPRNGIVDTPRFFFPDRERFDVTAVTDREWSTPPPGERVPSELRPMLRALLEERFQMEARIETKRVDVYAVRLVDADGEPGAGLRPSANECRGPYTDPAKGEAEDRPACPFRLEPGGVEAGAITMTEVARLISRIDGLRLDRIVVDGTGMPGIYDLRLSIDLPSNIPSPANFGPGGSVDGGGVIGAISLADRRPITIREALRDQLGLKLEKAKLPIPTLTIERAKRPRED